MQDKTQALPPPGGGTPHKTAAALHEDILLSPEDIRREFIRTAAPLPPYAIPGIATDTAQRGDGKERKRRKGFRHPLFQSAFFLLPLTLAVCASFLILFENAGLGRYRLAHILTQSMQSELPQGSLIVTQCVPPEQLTVGDIISYRKKTGESVTHRIISVAENDSGERSFQTRGTDNTFPDPAPVPAEAVLGKVVWHIPFAGNALAWLGANPLAALGCVAGVALCLLLPGGVKKTHFSRCFATKQKAILQRQKETVPFFRR